MKSNYCLFFLVKRPSNQLCYYTHKLVQNLPSCEKKNRHFNYFQIKDVRVMVLLLQQVYIANQFILEKKFIGSLHLDRDRSHRHLAIGIWYSKIHTIYTYFNIILHFLSSLLLVYNFHQRQDQCISVSFQPAFNNPCKMQIVHCAKL